MLTTGVRSKAWLLLAVLIIGHVGDLSNAMTSAVAHRRHIETAHRHHYGRDLEYLEIGDSAQKERTAGVALDIIVGFIWCGIMFGLQSQVKRDDMNGKFLLNDPRYSEEIICRDNMWYGKDPENKDCSPLVPISQVWAYSIVVPIICLVCYAFSNYYGLGMFDDKTRLGVKIASPLIGIFAALGTQYAMTHWLKYTTQRFRPDFMRYCLGEYTTRASSWTIDPKCTTTSACDVKECWAHKDSQATQEDKDYLQERQKSFPSGHTATAFAGGHMIYILLTELGVLSSKSHTDGNGGLAKGVLGFAAGYIFPIYVGMSRLLDHRHHPEDVVAGAMIGIVSAETVFGTFIRQERNALEMLRVRSDVNTAKNTHIALAPGRRY